MIPLEDFFRKPDKVALQLSPDGRHLAWMEPYERRLNVVVRDLATGETRRVTAATERDVAGYFWTSSERLVDFEAAIADLPKAQPGALAVPLTRGTVARLRGVGGLVVDDQAATRTDGGGGLLDSLESSSTQGGARSDVWIEHFHLLNPER